MSKQKEKLTKSQKRKYVFGIFGVVLSLVFGPIVFIVLAVVLAKQKKKWLAENAQNEQLQQQSQQTAAASAVLEDAEEEESQAYSGDTVEATSVGNGRLGRLKSRFKSGVGEAEKARTGAFISVLVMYIVIFAATFIVNLVVGRRISQASLVASAVSFGYRLIIPSFFVYLGSHNPFNLKKSITKLFIALGIVGMILCDIYGILIIPRYVAPDMGTVHEFIISKFIPIALCVSTVAYILVYLVWCKGLSSKWYAGMAYVTTVLFPVATALILAVIALYVAWTLLIWLLSAIKVLLGGTPIERGFKKGWSGKGQSSSGYEIIDESGYRRTLTPYEGNRYRDDTGAFWVSDDGGNSFRRD